VLHFDYILDCACASFVLQVYIHMYILHVCTYVYSQSYWAMRLRNMRNVKRAKDFRNVEFQKQI
jgi:hypothetical protein